MGGREQKARGGSMLRRHRAAKRNLQIREADIRSTYVTDDGSRSVGSRRYSPSLAKPPTHGKPEGANTVKGCANTSRSWFEDVQALRAFEACASASLCLRARSLLHAAPAPAVAHRPSWQPISNPSQGAFTVESLTGLARARTTAGHASPLAVAAMRSRVKTMMSRVR